MTDFFTNATRRLDKMFPGMFKVSPKHDHNVDFGYPDVIEFNNLYSLYDRNGLATAGVDRTILKTWETNPVLTEDENSTERTPDEQEIERHLSKIRFWQTLQEADTRSLVGDYAAVVFRFADDQMMDQPVTALKGIESLVEVISCWQSQLFVAEWDTDTGSENYGKPKMYTFKESQLPSNSDATNSQPPSPREFSVHPDRVLIWSKNGTTHCRSVLRPGYNDLVAVEKIIGAGGEGFWKNARSAPVLEIDKDAKIDKMAQAMGVKPSELADKMNEQMEEFQKGFDSTMLLQGINAKTLGISLPQPGEFVNVALQSYAGSLSMPIKILVGSQTGERASTEDSREWSQTIMSRRNNVINPLIETLIDRFKRWSLFKDKEWDIAWDDLTEATMTEKIDRASKMTEMNAKQYSSGASEVLFTEEEIRETVGLKPLTPDDALIDTGEEDDEEDDPVIPPKEDKEEDTDE